MKFRVLSAAVVIGALGLLSMAADAPKTYKVDNDGFIQNWLVLDPIAIDVSDHTEDVEKPIFAKEYFKDEMTTNPKADSKVTVNGKELQWRPVKIDDYQIDLVQFADDHSKPTEQVLFLGVAYVIAPEDIKDVKLAIGSDDSSVWWVNGKELIRAYEGRQVNQDDNVSKPVTLNKGVNVVRFAVTQGDGPAGACARFLDSQDKPVKNITVTLEPPAAATQPQ